MTERDERVLDRWVAALRGDPSRLPDGVEPVQVRLVRAVGRGTLPSGRIAYVKSMGFPRLRDRVRYAVRRLPAVHEARVLTRLHALRIGCPEVLRAVGQRRRGIPHASILVTRELVAAARIDFERAAGLAARLAHHGIYHPDLKPDNLVVGEDGETAVLDLQSARVCSAPLPNRLRLRMAIKLVAEFDAVEAAGRLVEIGLIADAREVEARVAALRAVDRRRRIRRCLTTSTEFVVERRWNGRVHRRRAVVPPVDRGWQARPDAVELWIGDRVREVRDEARPLLGALFRRAWWSPGSSSIYVVDDESEGTLSPIQSELLLDAFRRGAGP